METVFSAADLAARWVELRKEEPHLRIREAAARLGSSEAGLLSLQLGTSVRRLRCEPAALLDRLADWGPVMALTRNEGAVHERRGVWGPLKAVGNVGLVNTQDIDLRLDFLPWTQAYAEEKDHAGRRLRSLQFFDAQGTAVHKVFLESDNQALLWEALVGEFHHADQETPFVAAPSNPGVNSEMPLSPAASASLVEAWRRLEDPHHFSALLKRQKVTRRQAMTAAEGAFTRRLGPGSLLETFRGVAGSVPIMVFVGNPGCVQIHTGLVHKVEVLGPWVNVLDPAFNLHVDLGVVAEAWSVVKPSPDGPVTSVEYLDAQGELIVQLFGERKPGKPELEDWRSLVGRL